MTLLARYAAFGLLFAVACSNKGPNDNANDASDPPFSNKSAQLLAG